MNTGAWIILFVFFVLFGLFLRRFLQILGIKNYTPEEVHDLVKNDTSVVLLDVRTPEERSLGTLQGSVNVPVQQLRWKIDSLKKYKDRTIICYCQTGSRSVSAAVLLKKKGFTAANMKGGIAEWNFSNLKK